MLTLKNLLEEANKLFQFMDSNQHIIARAQENSMQSIDQAHWRDSARAVKFFIWDGKTAFPMLLFLLHIKIWTFAVALAAMIFFSILNRYGFSVDVFLRWFRSRIAGRRKIAVPWWET